MNTVTEMVDHPQYDAVATEASKAAIFWFFVTFGYLLFFTPVSPGVLGGIGFAIGGMFAVSLLVAAPLLIINLKLGWSVWFFKLTCAPATIAATWFSYQALFGG